MVDSEIINAIQGIREDDIIIAFMGPTGTGKGHFIDLLTGDKGRRTHHMLKSKSAGIEATRVKHPTSGSTSIVLVDTPGFDDTTRSDMEILHMISDWLEKTYSRNIMLSGLIYLHRISDNRVPGSASRCLRMFSKLCGDSAMIRVVLVSTMWEKVQVELGERRETQLKDEFWKSLIEKGSGVERLKRSDGDEAWRIVDDLIKKHKDREAVLLQEELVELQRKLDETGAGRTLYKGLEKLLADQKDALKSLLAQVESMTDPELKKEMRKEYKKIKVEIQKTLDEVKKTKVSLGRRILMFFLGKRIRAKFI